MYLSPLRIWSGHAKRIPPEALAYPRGLGKKFGCLGRKTAAKNMTREERLAWARKASAAAARKRRAEWLARDRSKESTQQ